jgi:hypothetical protein
MRTPAVTAAHKDRVLYWPTMLAVGWFLLFIWSNASKPDSLYLETPFVFLYWLISAGVGVVACIAWICERSWLRFASTTVLPLSVIVMAFVWWR